MTFTIFQKHSILREQNRQSAIFQTLKWRGTHYNKDSFKRVVSLIDIENM